MLGSGSEPGLVVGGQLGANYQISTWVFGVEGDAARSDASGTHADQMNAGLTDQSKIDLLSSVTGRFGYAWDRLLSYAKAGGAWTHDKYDLLFPDNTTFATASETRSDWAVGGGFEYAITSNFTILRIIIIMTSVPEPLV